MPEERISEKILAVEKRCAGRSPHGLRNGVFIRFNPDGKGEMPCKLARQGEEMHFQIERIETGEDTEPLVMVYSYYADAKVGTAA